MTDSLFKSDLEKQVWAAVYTRYEAATTKERMRNAWKLVVELRSALDKLLAFGAWTHAAAEILGEQSQTVIFRNDFEKQIWVSAFTRYIPDKEKQSVEYRAKRAWEFVLEFRQPQKEEGEGWEAALHELVGKTG